MGIPYPGRVASIHACITLRHALADHAETTRQIRDTMHLTRHSCRDPTGSKRQGLHVERKQLARVARERYCALAILRGRPYKQIEKKAHDQVSLPGICWALAYAYNITVHDMHPWICFAVHDWLEGKPVNLDHVCPFPRAERTAKDRPRSLLVAVRSFLGDLLRKRVA